MKRTGVVVIGGGQAGLAMSRLLLDRRIDHVVLERGRVAERWRTERWDSLRLLTPNWMARLPGHAPRGADPDGFMTMPEVIGFLEDYARSFDAPVETGTTVSRVTRAAGGYRVQTDRGTWAAPHVVVATGYCDRPRVPAISRGLYASIVQLAPGHYRNLSQLPDGGVLVVGASSSGVQLADEIHASGRPVTLAVGRHTRLPRTYRGRDILWWMDRMGVLGESIEHVFDVEASRRQPSLQLVGRPDRRTLGLLELRAQGVRVVGRAIDAAGSSVTFDDDLLATTAAADYKLAGLLRRIDRFVRDQRLEARVEPPEPFEPSWPAFEGADRRRQIDLGTEGIRTVIWATGYRREYPWLQVPGVLDGAGELRHRGGVTPSPGLYVLGLQFQRRRNSAFIDGVGDDARAIAEHLDGRRMGRHDDRAVDHTLSL